MLLALGTILLLYTPSVTASYALHRYVESYIIETSLKRIHANDVVEKVAKSFQQWFFTVTFCEFTYFENRVLNYIETIDDLYPVILLDGCPNRNRTRYRPRMNVHGRTTYVVTASELNNVNSEYVIEALLRTGVFQPRSTVIFILNTPVTMNSYFFYMMRSHFHLLWSRSITNSVVMIAWNGKLMTYTYNYFRDDVEDVTDVKDIREWLSHQYDDLHGHEFRLSVFRKIYLSWDKGPIRCDSRLALTVMSQLNATCRPLPARDGNTVGEMLPNGSATGVTADLLDGYTELELNSRILKNSYYGYLDTTYPLTQDDLCFLVKNHEKQSTFKTIIQLISVRILLIFIFNVIALSTIAIVAREMEMRIWNVRERRSIGESVMDLVKCFLRQTVNVTFPAFVYRCVMLIIIVYSLVINCAIDGIITSAVTSPRYDGPVNTMEDLIQSNLTIAIFSRHFPLFNKTLDDDAYNILKNRIELISSKKMVRIIEDRQFQYAVMLRKVDLQYIVTDNRHRENGRPVFRMMPDCLITCSIVYGMRYGTPYLIKINNILHHLNQGGILQYWAKSDELKGSGSQLQQLENKELRSLTMGNLQELFIVWAFGLLVSATVFLFEILLSKNPTIIQRQILWRRRNHKDR